MKKITFTLLTLTLIFSFCITPVLAVEDGSIETEADETQFEELEVEEINEVPSNFGLWWRGVKENVSLAFTFDEVSKAEKRIKFAEARMRIAELMAEKTDNPDLQAKAEKMAERAQKMMDKVEAKRERWANHKNADKVQKLMRNIATHQVRKQAVFDKLEEKLSDKNLERIQNVRQAGLENSQRLLNALQNENIPEDVKEHLEQIQDRIQTHVQSVKDYNTERKELINQWRAGDEDAHQELKELNKTRVQEIKNRVRTFQRAGVLRGNVE